MGSLPRLHADSPCQPACAPPPTQTCGRLTQDWFGLKTADEAGKIVFNSTAGNHLQFTEADLAWWIYLYFVDE